ncbi:alpha-L-rhamnosidase [Paenibacillus darwinianus]|uniref:alpha-L-rhamnosidase n=1 Tax=Paenibacillus darwinianus TaxID=1380763 RepID=A0A9W5S3H3_9BACL|nr:alpha-L-rhamnosidase [Paenibacillus darwinianus]EXX89463.1 alpha-L-rhamnosidase [Paenibacillus darwinianus]EXX90745.1 alpha-L-rhamnosidase [Paenibacillus darwinianus]EXX90903.1 alpha-L-rhamnosidase [Paenibacillus darwinianus]
MPILNIRSITSEYREHLLGADIAVPRFSWILESEARGVRQTAYRLQLTGGEGNFDAPLWDTGRVDSGQSIHIPYTGPGLAARTAYQFRVKVWDAAGQESAWSAAARLELGLLDPAGWQANWITLDSRQIAPDAKPAFLLRKRFELGAGIVSARVYATAAGVYELYVNGAKVSNDLLAPGWTSYRNRLQYQTYDVTGQIKEGGNGVGILLGDGWYRGGLGFEGRNYMYGDRRAALLQLHVRYGDGTEAVVATDSTWRASLAPIQYSNIYHGETYDARLERRGWSEDGFNDAEWSPVEQVDLPLEQLVAQENWPTRVTETIRPVSTFVTPAGDRVLDMGQNMVGRMRMAVQAPAGTRIVLRHAEVLDKDGNIYFGNLRPAKQTVAYIAKGAGEESYAPHFTFQGFRYVQVEGFPGQENGLPLEAFRGEVMHSQMPPTGEFECSDERVNQLQRNIKWGQRGNFLDVPTDCPQRDERLGWTGDAQVFISTALFNFQGAPFFTKWLRDLKAEQHPDGGIPFVIPDIVGGASSAAWGDAAVICPWTVYQYYGDQRLLAEQYESMKRWVEYIRAQGENEHLWNSGFHFGDWLGLDAKENSYIGATPTALIATAYYAYSTRLLRDAAKALGYSEDAERYDQLLCGVLEAFRDEFVTKTGRVASPTQTAHVLALAFDLVDGQARARVAEDLNNLIVENDYHLTTGFVGTPYLCFALSNSGFHTTAVRLLLQESYPGWLYSVSKGATTIWEHWDSVKPDGSFWSDDMNSFNHYAYGAIGDWMYRKVAGLDMDPAEPAFRRIRIDPLFGSTLLTHARAAHHSMYGRIASGWRVDGGRIEVEAVIPANTTAEILLRGAALAGTSEGGSRLNAAEGVTAVDETAEGLRITVGSGSYRFAYESPNLFRERYSEKTKLNEVLMDERATGVLNRHAPHLLSGALVNIAKPFSFKQIGENGMMRVPREKIDEILKELAEL